jgi:ribosome recycling factor
MQVEYYGSWVSLQSLAAISVPEAQVIMIRPFDIGSLKMIEKAIAESDLKINPHNDGKVIRLNIPPLTQDRRKDLAKQVGKRVEEAKISIRNARREAMEMMKELEDEKMISEDDHKRGKEELEKVTKSYIEKGDEHGQRKEREIMDL